MQTIVRYKVRWTEPSDPQRGDTLASIDGNKEFSVTETSPGGIFFAKELSTGIRFKGRRPGHPGNTEEFYVEKF